MYADELAWLLRNTTESEISEWSDEVVETYREILKTHRKHFNSDLAAMEIHRLTRILEDEIEVYRNEIECCGCDKYGRPNYGSRFYCGGSERCIP